MKKDRTTNIAKAWCCLFAMGMLLLLAACGGTPTTASTSTPTAAPTTAPTATPTTAPTATPTENEPHDQPTTAPSSGNSVAIANFAFSPASLTVKVGTKVTWTNNDSTAHTVTADQGAFDSQTVDPGGTFSFTFNHAGTFTYHCAIHSSMTATITVQ
jgi:plastocyanin